MAVTAHFAVAKIGKFFNDGPGIASAQRDAQRDACLDRCVSTCFGGDLARQASVRAADSTTCGAVIEPSRPVGSAYAVEAESTDPTAASTTASCSSVAAHVPLRLGGVRQLLNAGRGAAVGF